MQLVDEQHHLTFSRLDLLQHRLQAFLELAAILRPGDHRAKVERQQLLALQRLRHIAVDDAQCKALNDGGLADAGLADQHRIVLRAARQHLDGTADLFVAPDHRIELAVTRQRRHVARILLQRVEGGFRVRAGDLAALADLADRLLQRLRVGASAAQGARGGAVGCGECHQQTVLRDVFVTGLGCGLLRRVEHAHQIGGDLRLPGTGALHLRQAHQFRFDPGESRFRIAARGADQAGCGAFLVVQQCLQQVLRRDLLVEFADGDGLGSLQKSARPLGEFLNVHVFVPLRRRRSLSPSLIRQRKCEPLASQLGPGRLRLKGDRRCASNTCIATR